MKIQGGTQREAVFIRGTGLPQTSNLETATKPPTPWPEPGISWVQPISSTLDKSGLSTRGTVTPSW